MNLSSDIEAIAAKLDAPLQSKKKRHYDKK